MKKKLASTEIDSNDITNLMEKVTLKEGSKEGKKDEKSVKKNSKNTAKNGDKNANNSGKNNENNGDSNSSNDNNNYNNNNKLNSDNIDINFEEYKSISERCLLECAKIQQLTAGNKNEPWKRRSVVLLKAFWEEFQKVSTD